MGCTQALPWVGSLENKNAAIITRAQSKRILISRPMKTPKPTGLIKSINSKNKIKTDL
ncbi:hypothetical protein D039_4389 [Vibrio parahaemolyticus EKP-028]|nr:hypothetical protein D039_4389 [Vibrio parahaemolyticus EKP-028]